MNLRQAIGLAALAGSPFALWLLPVAHRAGAMLFWLPALWLMVSVAAFPLDRESWNLLGRRKFWPLVWAVFFVGLGGMYVAVGYLGGMAVFTYGVPRPETVFPKLFPAFLLLLVVLTLGVERPLRKLFLERTLLARNVPLPLAMGLCSLLGVLRSLPFHWGPWVDTRYLIFALIVLAIRELTLCRLYLVSKNLLACGLFSALSTLVEAYMMTDILSPHLPAFYWASSSTALYVIRCAFALLPLLILHVRLRRVC